MAEPPGGTVLLPERFADITEAIEKNLRMEMLYATGGFDTKTRVIRPISVHDLNAVVYLNAFCELVGAERTFRLDRIQRIKLL